jgi:hypothetical protein
MRRLFLFVLAIVGVCAGARAGEGYRFLEIDGHDVKWGAPLPGHGAVLTYAIAGDATGNINCRSTTSLDGLLARSKLSQAQFDGELRAAFAMWSKVADVRFAPAASPAEADLKIVAEATADGIAYSDVTPVPTGGGDFHAIKSGIVCLNPAVRWAADGRAGSYRLRYVLAHEVGHILGLDHPSPRGELMSFDYDGKLTVLQQGDIEGMVALYGPSRTRALALNGTRGPLSFRLK